MRFLFYFLIAVVLPGVSSLMLHHLSSSDWGAMIGLATAGVYLAVAFAWTQLNVIAVHFSRLVKWVLKIERDLDKPPNIIEKIFYLAPPVVAAIGIYSVVAIFVAWLDTEYPVLTLVLVGGFGVVYGAVVSIGFSKELIDPDDVGPIGADIHVSEPTRPKAPKQ